MATAPDKTRLTILLGRYGRDEFYKQNKYELMGTATSPAKRVSTAPLWAVEETGEFESWNDSKIGTWVDSVLSRRVRSFLFSVNKIDAHTVMLSLLPRRVRIPVTCGDFCI